MTVGFVKSTNAFLAGYSYLKSYITRNPSVSGMPLSISMELTNHCNLSCPECPSGSGLMKRGRGYMDPDLYNKVISELRPFLFYVNLYFQGEPMLHPQFFEFLAEKENFHTVVSTNGHFLSAENSEKLVNSNLSRLIVSLDGMTPETFSIYRREGNFNTVLNGIGNIAEAIKRRNSSLQLVIQFLVNRSNETQIPEAKSFANEVKARLKLKSMQIYNQEEIDYWQPSGNKFRRYEKVDGSYLIRNSLPNNCRRLWFNPVITWDGKVVPCCFDKDAEHIMGDLKKKSFREIWDDSQYRLFRKRILAGRNSIEICSNCTSGLKRGIIQ